MKQRLSTLGLKIVVSTRSTGTENRIFKGGAMKYTISFRLFEKQKFSLPCLLFFNKLLFQVKFSIIFFNAENLMTNNFNLNIYMWLSRNRKIWGINVLEENILYSMNLGNVFKIHLNLANFISQYQDYIVEFYVL